MPFVRVTSFPWTKKQREAVAREITAAIAKHVGAHPDVTWVLFEKAHQPHWFLGGREFKGRWGTAAPPLRKRGRAGR